MEETRKDVNENMVKIGIDIAKLLSMHLFHMWYDGEYQSNLL